MTETKNPPRNRFVITASSERQVGAFPGHDRLWIDHDQILNGALRLEVETLAPVHVGSGAFTLTDLGEMAKEPVRWKGLPVLPGSSLKGICRQTHEVLTGSGSPFDEGKNKDKPLSPSATLFGSFKAQGRLSFDDAVPLEPVEPVLIRLSVPYEPDEPKGRRFYGPMRTGADQEPKIPALALPGGIRLRTTLRFRNVQAYELGVVLMALGFGDPSFDLKVGGGKYDAFGWVKFHATEYRFLAGLRAGTTPWSPAEAFCQRLLKAAFLPPAGKLALKEFQRRMQIPAHERRIS